VIAQTEEAMREREREREREEHERLERKEIAAAAAL